MNELLEDRKEQKKVEQIIHNIVGTMPILFSDLSTHQNLQTNLLVNEITVSNYFNFVLK